ncbi:MAG: DEAD/DEAH box helicase, partial [Synechococcaceae cyanobacterium]|nr:DEAD/DEAH box helicase [Synechococcaceae cyanobacterium]
MTPAASNGPDLEALFPFPLDAFQLEAIDALNQGHSVVVSAPTGSGKTLVGEYAIHRALAHGRKVLYTTPLKALSNQKLRDFRQRFGADQVGLLTGDLSLNREARIVVMTTEIFRNML